MGKLGEGVHDSYKERANKGGDILWHVTVKGQNELAPGIPLHMSLKVFGDKKEMNLDEIKHKVEVFDIKPPKPEKLTFKTTIFTSEIDGKQHYMLLVNGVDKEYSEFYEDFKHCGTVYKKFMPHITIDKGLYDKINKEGLKADEVSFGNLTIEAGAGNTIFAFNKSEKMSIVRDTIRLNTDLHKHINVTFLNDEYLNNYLQDNPSLERVMLKKHEQRIKAHFGDDQKLIQIAWEQGLKEAYKAKEGK
jgi:hypothetical protein